MARYVHFVTGGARSGKSRFAQRLAEELPAERLFIATAEAWDEEMAERIARHRADRGPAWSTVEAPYDLPATIAAADRSDRVLLVDCLTLWASNLILAERDVDPAVDALVAALRDASGAVVLVSNEVGMGIVPDNALARRFRDVAGTINQRVAAIADRATLVVSGLPVALK